MFESVREKRSCTTLAYDGINDSWNESLVLTWIAHPLKFSLCATRILREKEKKTSFHIIHMVIRRNGLHFLRTRCLFMRMRQNCLHFWATLSLCLRKGSRKHFSRIFPQQQKRLTSEAAPYSFSALNEPKRLLAIPSPLHS